MFLNTLLSSVDTFSGSGYENLAEDSTFSQRLIYGLKICGIGMTVVFLVLIILCLVLYCFKLYYNINEKKKTSPAGETPPAVIPVASTAPDDEQTVVAVATAAIAASRNAKDAAFKVISVKKIK